MNSAENNEGYWEAIRVPTDAIAWESGFGEDFKVQIEKLTNGTFANHSSFQSGQLRDIHRFQFKLNSVAPDHPFVDPVNAVGNEKYVDGTYDCIIIRLVGRIHATETTVLMYDHVSNQEVVFRDDTIMAKLSTPNVMIPNMGLLLNKAAYDKPAIQIK